MSTIYGKIMSWFYNNSEVDSLDMMPEKTECFVYLIENLSSGKKYIGKKRLFFLKSKQVKGKKKKYKVESDWKEYYGSNDFLKADVEKLGVDNFRREILYYCPNLGTASYLELREQIDRRVLESDDYYNGWIQVRVNQSHLKLG